MPGSSSARLVPASPPCRGSGLVPGHLGASSGTVRPRVHPDLKALGHPGFAVSPEDFALAQTRDSGCRTAISLP